MDLMDRITNKRWLTLDPGEDAGWSVWNGTTLIGAGTTKMWSLADDLYDAVLGEQVGPMAAGDQHWVLDGKADLNVGDFSIIVCEDWRLYPWKLQEMSWDECRTARLIGAVTLIARVALIPIEFQGAKIKERAVAGGAQDLFYKPLTENRHQNDAIMHGVYFSQVTARA